MGSATRAAGCWPNVHALGRKADSDAALAALVAKYEKDSPYNIAYVYAYRGEADNAVEYGDRCLSDIVTENLFEKIHADPRWLAFLRKVGKAPEQLAKIELKVAMPGGGWHGERRGESLAAADREPRKMATPKLTFADGAFEVESGLSTAANVS